MEVAAWRRATALEQLVLDGDAIEAERLRRLSNLDHARNARGAHRVRQPDEDLRNGRQRQFSRRRMWMPWFLSLT
jgi:hypothetical protein